MCGDVGLVCKQPDYCADGVRCAGGVSLVWAFVGNCRKQSFGEYPETVTERLIVAKKLL